MNRVKTLFILNIILFFTSVGSLKALEVIRDTEIENFTNDIVKILQSKFTSLNVEFLKNNELIKTEPRNVEVSQSAISKFFDGKVGLQEGIEKLINERKALKENKDFIGADAIRDSLLEKGIELIDSEDGTTWKSKH